MTNPYAMPAHTLTQVEDVLRQCSRGEIGSPVAVSRIAAIVGEPLHPAPPDPADCTTHCVLCLNVDGTKTSGPVMVDGYSMCPAHAGSQVLVWTMDQRLHLDATIAKARGRSGARGMV